MERSGFREGNATCSWTPAGSYSARASTPPAYTDRDGAQGLLSDELKEELPQLELLWADGAYTRGFSEWAQKERGWRVEVPHHRDRQLWRYGL